ncbi:MAG: hypothetical protein R3E55_13650 [Burkholderiaceae bacterium]
MVLFIGLSIFLPGFLSVPNLLALLQSVAILGIPGLAMAPLSSLGAASTSPSSPRWRFHRASCCSGSERPLHAEAIAAAFATAVAFGLVNGWLVAYAEVPSLLTTLEIWPVPRRLRPGVFQLDVVQWSDALSGSAVAWTRQRARLPKPVVMFTVAALAITYFPTRLGAFIYALGDNLFRRG